MKKIISLALIAAAVSPVFAQEAAPAKEEAALPREERARSDVWPAFIAVCEFPDVTDVVGLRLTLPFSTRPTSVTLSPARRMTSPFLYSCSRAFRQLSISRSSSSRIP